MRVVFRYDFDENALRAVRAAHGRGGVASRKECVTFMHRAVLSALEEAPTPRPKRRPRPPVEEISKVAPAEKDPVAERDRIRKLYVRSPR